MKKLSKDLEKFIVDSQSSSFFENVSTCASRESEVKPLTLEKLKEFEKLLDFVVCPISFNGEKFRWRDYGSFPNNWILLENDKKFVMIDWDNGKAYYLNKDFELRLIYYKTNIFNTVSIGA